MDTHAFERAVPARRGAGSPLELQRSTFSSPCRTSAAPKPAKAGRGGRRADAARAAQGGRGRRGRRRRAAGAAGGAAAPHGGHRGRGRDAAGPARAQPGRARRRRQHRVLLPVLPQVRRARAVRPPPRCRSPPDVPRRPCMPGQSSPVLQPQAGRSARPARPTRAMRAALSQGPAPQQTG